MEKALPQRPLMERVQEIYTAHSASTDALGVQFQNELATIDTLLNDDVVSAAVQCMEDAYITQLAQNPLRQSVVVDMRQLPCYASVAEHIARLYDMSEPPYDDGNLQRVKMHMKDASNRIMAAFEERNNQFCITPLRAYKDCTQWGAILGISLRDDDDDDDDDDDE